MVDSIPCALVLEDDITITESAKEVISTGENALQSRSREIYLLNTPEAITPLLKKNLTENVHSTEWHEQVSRLLIFSVFATAKHYSNSTIL